MILQNKGEISLLARARNHLHLITEKVYKICIYFFFFDNYKICIIFCMYRTKCIYTKYIHFFCYYFERGYTNKRDYTLYLIVIADLIQWLFSTRTWECLFIFKDYRVVDTCFVVWLVWNHHDPNIKFLDGITTS